MTGVQTCALPILMEAVENDGEYVSLAKSRPGQKVFREIILQSLNDLEFDGNYVARWRPKKFRQVIIDPRRHFGDPVLDEFGISTRTLHDEFLSFKDTRYLSKIYEIPERDLKAGIFFEKSLDEIDGQSSL